MIKETIARILDREDLTREQAKAVMDHIMSGSATPAQIGGFLTALRMKGETVEEITGFALSMRGNAKNISPDVEYLIDTCGTGGDGAHTFNISTAAAIVAGAAGISVAKHGNRSVSSRSGSADVLEELGVTIDLPPDDVCRCIEEVGIGFMFAPGFHGAMKHAIGPRRELGVRTVFNVLGPLTNPAGAEGQLMGVYGAGMTEPMAIVLKNLGVRRAMVVHSQDGLDEISASAPTKVAELEDGAVRTYMIRPEDLGFIKSDIADVKGEGPKANADIIISLLGGEKGPKRDVLLLNAGAAIYVGNGAGSLGEGIRRAAEVIDNGGALKKLQELIAYTRSARREN
ncbi:MAG: anthranilate phosphoribosyltransferase [Eubacteriales bacterium]|nr:anthranilate phosphoribosyltransferase [Eubacteriales bacterium]